MKKNFIAKPLALLLALALAFALALPAFAEDTIIEAPVVNLSVGEIVTGRQLVESMGYTYRDDRVARCSGAVRLNFYGMNPNCWLLYGANVGQGTATLNVEAGTQIVFTFNVTAASNPLVREVSAESGKNIPIAPTLTAAGYTLVDVDKYAFWTTKIATNTGSSTLLRGSLDGFYTDEYTGEGQILLNMRDGKIILINVTITEASGSWLQEVGSFLIFPFLGPVLAIVAPAFMWPMIFAPLVAPVIWILRLIFPSIFDIPVRDQYPVLVLE